MAFDFNLELRGGPHNGNRPVITAENGDINSFPVYYTWEGERYERTLMTTHGGERIYVYLYPEPVVDEDEDEEISDAEAAARVMETVALENAPNDDGKSGLFERVKDAFTGKGDDGSPSNE